MCWDVKQLSRIHERQRLNCIHWCDAVGVYRATEDVTGSHRKLLERLGTAMLLPFIVPEARGEDVTEQRNERTSAGDTLVGRAAASTGVLGAIMDVEHRALHARLDSLWDVLWLSASQSSAAGAIAQHHL